MADLTLVKSPLGGLLYKNGGLYKGPAAGAECCCEVECDPCTFLAGPFGLFRPYVRIARTSSLDEINVSWALECPDFTSVLDVEILVDGVIHTEYTVEWPDSESHTNDILFPHDPSDEPTYRVKVYCQGNIVIDTGDVPYPISAEF